jgi:hypothetical protein
MLRSAIAQQREIARVWPELRQRYRDAQPHLTSSAGWKQVFDPR